MWNRAVRRYMIKAAHYLVLLHCVCFWNVGFLGPFIHVLWSPLSQWVYLSLGLSRPVLAMQGKTSRQHQIYRLDKCFLKRGPSQAGLERSSLQFTDLEVCWNGTNAAAALVESWYKPGTLGWTTMPDTYSLQWGMCLNGIGLTTGKKTED